MSISNTTTATVVESAILTEWINREMRRAVDSPNNLHRDICFIPPPLVNTKRWSPNIYANLTTTVSATEGGDITMQEFTPAPVDIDSALFATGVAIGDWANVLAVHPLIPGAVEALMNAAFRKLETDALGLASSMSNSIGNSTTTMDADNWVTVTSSFRAQAKRSSYKPLMVLSESAKRDLTSDTMKNGAGLFGSLIGVQLHQAASKLNQGEWTEFLGYMIAGTDQIPTVSSGKGNFVVHMGPAEYALGMCFSMGIRVVPAAMPQNLALYLIVSHAHGKGIVEQARALRFITKP